LSSGIQKVASFSFAQPTIRDLKEGQERSLKKVFLNEFVELFVVDDERNQ